MPLYEYECKVCGYNLEIYQSLSEVDNIPMCGNCVDATYMHKSISAPAIHSSWGIRPAPMVPINFIDEVNGKVHRIGVNSIRDD